MVDINAKSFLQSQLGSKLFQQFTGKQPGPDDQAQQQQPDGAPRIESLERAKTQVEGSDAFAKGSDDPTRRGLGLPPLPPGLKPPGVEPPPPGPSGENRKFTVIISEASGKTRALSVQAGNSEAAKEAAKSSLKDGETIASVNETPGPGGPRRDRGVVA